MDKNTESGTAWAYNRYGKVVLARECTKLEGPFHCHCGQKHCVHLSKPSGNEGKRPFEAYFAHNGEPGSKRQCLGGGGGGGESELHLLAKALLQKRHGQYMFESWICEGCKWENDEILEGGEVRLEHRDEALGYRYDCYWTDGKRDVALEVFNTHACSEEKLQRVKQSGLVLAEFHAQDIKNKLLDISPGRRVWLHNLSVGKKLCEACIEIVVEEEQKAALDTECEELLTQAQQIEDEYCSKDAVLFPGLYKLTFGKHVGYTIQSVDMEGWPGVQYLFWMTGRKLDYRHPRMIKVMTTEALEVVRSLYPQAILAAENFINKTYHLRCLDCYVEVDKPWKCLCMECWWRRKDNRFKPTQGRLEM